MVNWFRPKKDDMTKLEKVTKTCLRLYKNGGVKTPSSDQLSGCQIVLQEWLDGKTDHQATMLKLMNLTGARPEKILKEIKRLAKLR